MYALLADVCSSKGTDRQAASLLLYARIIIQRSPTRSLLLPPWFTRFLSHNLFIHHHLPLVVLLLVPRDGGRLCG